MLNNYPKYYFSIPFPSAQKNVKKTLFFKALTVMLPF